jgi:sec-independent protein translocase protein TatA
MKYLATLVKSLIFTAKAMIFLGFMNVGGQEILFILLIVLLLFGAKKLPELARGMGSAIKEFQKAKDEFSDELHSAGKTDTAAAKPDVRSPADTVPRIESAPTASSASEPQRAPDQSRVPGGHSGQV